MLIGGLMNSLLMCMLCGFFVSGCFVFSMSSGMIMVCV